MGPYSLAVSVWRETNHTWDTPSDADLLPEYAAAAVAGTFLDRSGVTVDMADLSEADLGIILTAASGLEDMAGWARADVVLRLCQLLGVDGIGQMKSEKPAAYSELLARSKASYGTLQNDYTTAQAWPRLHRRPNLGYSHHQALNALPDRRQWAEIAEAEGWSVARTRFEVSEYINDQPGDEEKYSRFGDSVRRWGYMLGAQIEATNNSVTIEKDERKLIVTAYILPSGRAAIKLGDE